MGIEQLSFSEGNQDNVHFPRKKIIVSESEYNYEISIYTVSRMLLNKFLTLNQRNKYPIHLLIQYVIIIFKYKIHH